MLSCSNRSRPATAPRAGGALLADLLSRTFFARARVRKRARERRRAQVSGGTVVSEPQRESGARPASIFLATRHVSHARVLELGVIAPSVVLFRVAGWCVVRLDAARQPARSVYKKSRDDFPPVVPRSLSLSLHEKDPCVCVWCARFFWLVRKEIVLRRRTGASAFRRIGRSCLRLGVWRRVRVKRCASLFWKKRLARVASREREKEKENNFLSCAQDTRAGAGGAPPRVGASASARKRPQGRTRAFVHRTVYRQVARSFDLSLSLSRSPSPRLWRCACAGPRSTGANSRPACAARAPRPPLERTSD